MLTWQGIADHWYLGHDVDLTWYREPYWYREPDTEMGCYLGLFYNVDFRHYADFIVVLRQPPPPAPTTLFFFISIGPALDENECFVW